MSLEWAFFIGYFYSSIVAAIFISWVMYLLSANIEITEMFEKTNSSVDPKSYKSSTSLILSQWQVLMLGVVERFLYLTSIMIGKPEFIAVWLTIKTVYLSLSKKDVSGRRIYNNFLVGNGISILYAFAGAGFIQWMTGSVFEESVPLALLSAAAPVILSLLFVVFLHVVKKAIIKKYSSSRPSEAA